MALTGENNEGKEAPEDGAADAARGDRESILAAYQETMREFLEAQARVVAAFLSGAPSGVSEESDTGAPSTRPVPRLRRLSSRRSVVPGTPANPAQVGATAPVREHRISSAVTARPNPVAVPAPSVRSASTSNEPMPTTAMEQLVLRVVEERTGYPQDMLGLDQALEADLGIDSIKRVEIVAALLKLLPPSALAGQPDAAEILGKQTTLRGMITCLQGVASPRGHEGRDVSAAREIAPRFVIRARAETLRDVPLDPLEPGLALITGAENDGGLVAAAVVELENGGLHALRITPAMLSDAAGLRSALSAARVAHGPVRVLMHLLPASAAVLDPESAGLDLLRQQSERNEKSLALLLQLVAEDLRSRGRVLAASALGGTYGRDGIGTDGLTIQGGSVGLLKSLREEWSEVRVKAVDLDPQLSAAQNAGYLLTELCLPGGRIEVGYPTGRRTVFHTEAAPLPATAPESGRRPDSGWVVLAIGGSRGITAEVLYELAPSGLRLIIVGRSPEPTPEAAEISGLDGGALREHLIRSARSQGRTLRPVDIQREVSALVQAREMRANLAGLRDAGASVEYRSCDMRDERDVKRLLDDVYAKYGRLDGVVLGAGVIEDKLLAEKDLRSWDRVFGTKVDSAFLLARHLRPETLRFLAFFTSVAGRYGNSGQTDYATANELLNRLAWQLQRRWQDRVKVSAINWGPWEGTRHGPGMVSEDTRRKFEGRGVSLVPPSGGASAFRREVLEAPMSDVEVVIGEGPWEKHETDMGRIESAGADSPERTTTADLPLLFGAVHSVESGGATLHLRRRITTGTDRYLTEHLLDDVPVLPAAVALELLAEAASAFWPSWHMTEVSDLRAMRGIKLTDGTFDAEVIAHGPPASEDAFEAALELRSAGVAGPPHYRARVHLARAVPAPLAHRPIDDLKASPMTARDAYRMRLFHGPCFQVITRLVAMEARGAVADTKPSDPREWLPGVRNARGWLFDPGLVDSAAQMALLWAYANGAESALPSRFRRVRRFGTEPLQACRMHFHVLPDRPEHQVHADVAFVDTAGNVRLLIEQLECTSSAALNRLGGGWKGEIRV